MRGHTFRRVGTLNSPDWSINQQTSGSGSQIGVRLATTDLALLQSSQDEADVMFGGAGSDAANTGGGVNDNPVCAMKSIAARANSIRAVSSPSATQG